MVWVVNAESFKGNFIMRSVVNSRLREFEQDASHLMNSLHKDLEIYKKSMDKKIADNEKECTTLNNQIEYNTGIKSKLIDNIQNLEILSNEIVNKWRQGKHYQYSYFYSITTALENEFKVQFQNLNAEISTLNRDLEGQKSMLIDISKLTTIIIDDKEYKIINYSQELDKRGYPVKLPFQYNVLLPSV